jgi:DNA mismatch repair protein MutS
MAPYIDHCRYRRLSAEHPTAIILYRMGDAYQALFDHARTVADVTKSRITRDRNGAPITGIPTWGLGSAVSLLTRAGYAVHIEGGP